jgi:Methyltransferase domain
VLGVEISEQQLRLARQRAGATDAAQVQLVLDDVAIHRFARASFDLAFSRFGVMFFADPNAATLTTDIRSVIESCPNPALTSDARSHQLAHIRRRLKTLRERRASMVSEHGKLRLSNRPVLAARQAVEAEIETLMAHRKRLRVDRPKWLDVTLSTRLNKLLTIATADPIDRHALHALFRLLFVKVVINWPDNQLVFHWQHGGESSVQVNMQPQRKVSNPRRGGRPRFLPGQMAPPLPVVAR